MKDHFKTLGISRNASSDDVKKAYRSLAKQLHPDKNPNGTEQFQDLQAAYECLKGDSDRDLYRRRLENLERAEKENSSKPATSTSSNNYNNNTSSSSNNTSGSNKTSGGSGTGYFTNSSQSKSEPRFTFFKDETPPSHKFSFSSDSKKSNSNNGSSQTKTGKGSNANSSGKPQRNFSARPSRLRFAFNLSDAFDDDDDAEASAFFSSRDFFKAAFNGRVLDEDEDPFFHADTFERVFERLFSGAAPGHGSANSSNNNSKARRASHGSNAFTSSSSSASNNNNNSSSSAKRGEPAADEDDFDDRGKRRSSFFFQGSSQAGGGGGAGGTGGSGAYSSRRVHFLPDDINDDDFDETNYLSTNPRFGKPNGKFASKSRKNEEGFISFDDDNPQLLLKCQYCNNKVAADKWHAHEGTCVGLRSSNSNHQAAGSSGTIGSNGGGGGIRPNRSGSTHQRRPMSRTIPVNRNQNQHRSVSPPLVDSGGGGGGGVGDGAKNGGGFAAAHNSRKKWNSRTILL